MRDRFTLSEPIRFLIQRVLGTLGIGVLIFSLLGFQGCESPSLSSPDFLLIVDTSEVAFLQGHSASIWITIRALQDFSGEVEVKLEVSVPSDDITTTLDDRTLRLLPGGQASTTLVVRSKLETPPGRYTVTVVATNETFYKSLTLGVEIERMNHNM